MAFEIKCSTPLMQFSHDDVNEILSKYGTKLEIVQRDIDNITNWIANQKYLPAIPSNQQIFNFLLMNRFSIEQTKEKIDMYYTIRSLIPDYYSNLLPSSFLIREMQKMVNLVRLPKLSKNFNRVIAYKIIDNTNPNFSSLAIFSYLVLFYEIKLLLDVSCNDDYLLDFSNATMEMIAKYTFKDIKNLVTIIEKVYSNRIAAVHIVKLPSFGEALFSVIKKCMKEKLRSRFYYHSSFESLKNYYSKDILPKDFGGDEKPMAELHNDWVDFFDKHEDHFVHLKNLKVDEPQRGKKLDVDEILGYHASFENLNVD